MVWVFYDVEGGGWEAREPELTSDVKELFLWFLSLIIVLYGRQPTPQEGLCSAVLKQ